MTNKLAFIIMALVFSAVGYAENLPINPQSSLPNSETVNSKTEKNAVKPQKSPSTNISLGTITTDVEGDLTIITARLNRNPEWKNLELEEHGTFLQVKLPNTQIPASGEFLDGNGPFLRKITSFQLGSEDGALRLFVNQDAAKAKLATSAELLGDRVLITIDHKKLEQLIAPAAKAEPTEAAAAAPTIDNAPKKPEATGAKELKNNAPTSADQKNEESNLHQQLTKGAAVCAVFFIALLAIPALKSRKKRASQSSKHSDYMEPATMKVLSSVSLGQKQKLTLVQVGSQQILLGITPDNINLLTNVETRPHSAMFSRALETANPDAEIKLKNPAEISSSPARRTLTPPTIQGRSLKPGKGSSINIGVGEDGPVELGRGSLKKDEDITKILRDRLRNLPPG